jgi:hypothetical protein
MYQKYDLNLQYRVFSEYAPELKVLHFSSIISITASGKYTKGSKHLSKAKFCNMQIVSIEFQTKPT